MKNCLLFQEGAYTRKLLTAITCVVLLTGLLLSSCNNDKQAGLKAQTGKHIANRTTINEKGTNVVVLKKWELPEELREISGLSHLDEQRLVCVQDELGKIYVYNTVDEKVEREISFGPAGDYEGLAVVGNDIWVLRADGVLFEVKNIELSQATVNKYTTLLTVKQDCEGLCYDSLANRLLVTVKAKDPNSTDYKGIYAFDVNTRRMAETPVFKLDMAHSIFTVAPQGKKKKKTGGIMPSGIAIHPATRELYITDGPKSRLLVMNPDGEISKLVQLDQKVFAQPEGIIFNAKGDLFISNEGPSAPGNILQVELQDSK